MKLTAGNPAPIFVAEDIFGTPVDLGTFATKAILLSFYRNGACALCNLQVHRVIQAYPDWQSRGLLALAVFESPRQSVLQHVGKQDAPFPIIADPDARLYDLYGVETSEEKVNASLGTPRQAQHIKEAEAIGYKLAHEEGSNFYRLPADFLIGPGLVIQRAFYSDAVGDHLPFEEIEQLLERLGQGIA